MSDDTIKLKESFVQDLELQKQNLYNAFVFQGMNPGENEGMNTLIPKVKDIEGNKPDIPVIKFYAPNASLNQLTQAQFNSIKNVINFNTLKDLSYFMYNQQTLTLVDLSDLYIKPGTPVKYMLYNVTKPVKFSSRNDLTGITDISYAFYHTSASNKFDLSSFILDETQPIEAYYAFANVEKLPSNYDKCTFIPRGLFAYAYKKDKGVLDTSLLQFDCGNYNALNAFLNMFSSGIFDDVVFDLSFSNIKNFDGTAVTSASSSSGPFACSSSKSFTFINKDKCPLNMFAGLFGGLRTDSALDLTGLATNGASNFKNMCYTVKATSVDVSDIDFSNATDTSSMFYSSTIQTINLGDADFSKVTTFSGMFYSCSGLTTVLHSTGIDASSAKVVATSFASYSSSLVNLCPLLNLGKAYTQKSNNYSNYTLGLASCSKLTHESLIAILDGLYDLNISYNVANGGKLYTQKVALHATAKASLTAEEIAIATAKGWTVA